MVKIDNLSFKYDESDEKLFTTLSLEIEDGDVVLLMASPGEGKTTLSRIITGGCPKYTGGTISGEIDISGKSILPLDTKERIRLVGRVAQDTDEMILFSTVESELMFPLENLGFSRDEIETRISKSLETFELEKYRQVSTTELSGGEKMRLMCAILFAVDPFLYIFDESFDELSDRWRKKLASLIKERGRTTLVLASHPLAVYDGLYDKALMLENGTVANYEIKDLVLPPIDFNISNESIDVESLVVTRSHRSVFEESPFSLNVPSFSLKKGGLRLLMGENGAGKSTFSRVMCGLLKEDCGFVYINGKKTNEKDRRSKVAYLMQNPFEQLFLPTVYDEMKSTGASDEDIERALALFGIERGMYISEISYGKAKMVQAAVFYLLDRDYVILDELDSAIGYSDSWRAIKSFLDKGSGVLAITHDEYFASLLKAEITYIKDGMLCK